MSYFNDYNIVFYVQNILPGNHLVWQLMVITNYEKLLSLFNWKIIENYLLQFTYIIEVKIIIYNSYTCSTWLPVLCNTLRVCLLTLVLDSILIWIHVYIYVSWNRHGTVAGVKAYDCKHDSCRFDFHSRVAMKRLIFLFHRSGIKG